MTYYISATEIDLVSGATIGASTVPFNLGQTASIIFEYEGDVDGMCAAAGYSVPISTGATYAFATVRRAVRNGVTAYLLQTMFPNMNGPGDKANVGSACQTAYDTFRKSLKDGSLALVGAAQDSSGAGRAQAVAGGTASAKIDYCTQF